MAYNIKAAIRAAKNMQYEPIEVKVREATNNDAWGVSTGAMSDIARSTHHHDEYALLFKMVWKRLTDVDHVLHVQKALILVDFLLRNGAERFINDAKRRSRDISALQKYKQYDANNRDVGGDVRAKAKNVYELLTNDAKLAEERAKATSIRDVKLSGLGSDGYGPGDTSGDRERESHRDRFTDRDEGGGGDEEDHEWEKENEEHAEYDPTRKEREEAATEASSDDKRREERKKKKKEKKAAEAAAEAGEEEEEAPMPEEGEKKKKKKKKKSVADASEASLDDGTSAMASTAASTAPTSAHTSAATTPAFTASSAALDSFDAFAPAQHQTNGATAFGGAGAFAGQAPAAAAGEADKPKKSRKGKKGAEFAAAPASAPAASAAPSVSVDGDYDLTNFASSAAPHAASSGDIDILTGTTAPSGRLEDMFSQASIMDEPLDANGEEDDGFAVEEEPALLDMLSSHTADGQVVSPRHSGGGLGGLSAEPARPKDVWDLAADFTNIDNLKGTVAKKKTSQREEVSMSMMRGMQPFGGGNLLGASAPQPSAPAAAPSPFFGAPQPGMNAFSGMGGMGGGYVPQPMGGMGGHMPMGMQGGSHFGMQVGFGMAQGGAPGGGMPGGFGGMGGGFGAPPPSAAPTSDLPFAAAPTSASRTKMPANGKPLVFDAVPAARGAGQQQAAVGASMAHGPAGPNWNR